MHVDGRRPRSQTGPVCSASLSASQVREMQLVSCMYFVFCRRRRGDLRPSLHATCCQTRKTRPCNAWVARHLIIRHRSEPAGLRLCKAPQSPAKTSRKRRRIPTQYARPWRHGTETCLWFLASKAPDDECRVPLLINMPWEFSGTEFEPYGANIFEFAGAMVVRASAAKRARQQVFHPRRADPKIIPTRYLMTSVLPPRTNAPLLNDTSTTDFSWMRVEIGMTGPSIDGATSRSGRGLLVATSFELRWFPNQEQLQAARPTKY